MIGQAIYERISSAAVELYTRAAEYALTKGVVIADTKFEFGLIPSRNGSSAYIVDGQPMEIILVDEVLTPDSSRFWPADQYEEGRGQSSYDKQYLRDWLSQAGFKKGLERGLEGNGWTMTSGVVDGTRRRYEEAFGRLTGQLPR